MNEHTIKNKILFPLINIILSLTSFVCGFFLKDCAVYLIINFIISFAVYIYCIVDLKYSLKFHLYMFGIAQTVLYIALLSTNVIDSMQTIVLWCLAASAIINLAAFLWVKKAKISQVLLFTVIVAVVLISQVQTYDRFCTRDRNDDKTVTVTVDDMGTFRGVSFWASVYGDGVDEVMIDTDKSMYENLEIGSQFKITIYHGILNLRYFELTRQ